jgi:hypothetical protein
MPIIVPGKTTHAASRKGEAMIKRALLAAVVLASSVSPALAGLWVPQLTILVDPDGTAYLWNHSPNPASFVSFSIVSPDKNLDIAGWKSFSEFDDGALEAALGAGALDFEDTLLDPVRIGQTNGADTRAILPANAKFPLGKPFATLPPLPTDSALYWQTSEVVMGAGSIDIVYTPEPSTLLLATLAGLGLVAVRVRSKR